MQRFEDLYEEHQVDLIAAVLEVIGEAGCTSLEEVAAAEGVEPIAVWDRTVADAGFDRCRPWQGFPKLPKN